MLLGTVTRVGADGVYVKLKGAGSYDVLAAHWPKKASLDETGAVVLLPAPEQGDLVALDELKAQPGEHVIVAVLAS